MNPWFFLQELDQIAHRVMAVLRMTKRKLIMHLISVAASLARSRQVPCLLEVAHDGRHGSFGDTDHVGNVTEPCGRIGRDALERVRVVRHEPPIMVTFSYS
jgi:hypothetical protein